MKYWKIRQKFHRQIHKKHKKTEDQNYQAIYLLKKIYAHEEKAKVNNI